MVPSNGDWHQAATPHVLSPQFWQSESIEELNRLWVRLYKRKEKKLRDTLLSPRTMAMSRRRLTCANNVFSGRGRLVEIGAQDCLSLEIARQLNVSYVQWNATEPAYHLSSLSLSILLSESNVGLIRRGRAHALTIAIYPCQYMIEIGRASGRERV